VLLTSRDRLTSLVAEAGARRVTLDVLTPDEAHTLLGQLLGEVRVNAEPEAVAALARACAYLPLALRIAAANLTEPVSRSIASYVTELTARRDQRADDHADGESDEVAAVYATLDASYRTIPVPTQRLFRLLGLVPGPDVTPPAAAALASTSQAEARRELRRLARAHLLDERSPDRFSFHDLLRSYTRHLANREDPSTERDHALDRLLNWYLRAADAATTTLHPAGLLLPLPEPAGDATPAITFTEGGYAKAWFEAERPNLIAAARHAADIGPASLAWLLADRLRFFLLVSRRISDWSAIASKALAIAEQADAQQAVAAARFSLGSLALTVSQYPDAIRHLDIAWDTAQRVGWSEAKSTIVKQLGESYWYSGQLERAAMYLRESVALDRTAGRAIIALGDLGCVYQELGRLSEAAECLDEDLSSRRELGDQLAIASALNNLGMVYNELGDFNQAAAYLTEALQVCQELGLRYGEASTFDSLAAVHRDSGRLTDAVSLAHNAITIARELDAARTEAAAMNTLGSIHLRLGHASDALLNHQSALSISSAREAGAREPIIIALLGQASAHHRLGSSGTAYEATCHALTLARDSQYQVLVGQAMTLLADIDLANGSLAEAYDHGEQALASHRGTGYRLGEARTLALLGRIAVAAGDIDAVARHEEAARIRFAKLGITNPDEGPGTVR
jgi:tetratricopeptide (TPR) repeat protein